MEHTAPLRTHEERKHALCREQRCINSSTQDGLRGTDIPNLFSLPGSDTLLHGLLSSQPDVHPPTPDVRDRHQEGELSHRDEDANHSPRYCHEHILETAHHKGNRPIPPQKIHQIPKKILIHIYNIKRQKNYYIHLNKMYVKK